MLTDDYLRLLDRAVAIVALPETQYSYSDVGETLVRFLRKEISVDEALESLGHLEEDYAKERLISR